MPFWAPRRASGLNTLVIAGSSPRVRAIVSATPVALFGPGRQPDSPRPRDRPNLPPARRETLASPHVMVGFAGIVAGARRQ